MVFHPLQEGVPFLVVVAVCVVSDKQQLQYRQPTSKKKTSFFSHIILSWRKKMLGVIRCVYSVRI